MPKDMFRRAPLRLFTSATIMAVCLCAAPAYALGTEQPAANDRQVQAFFNGMALDQQLAEQYSTPPPQAAVAGQTAADAPRPAQTQTAPTPKSLDEPLDQALDDPAMDKLGADLDLAIAAGKDAERKTIADAPPSLVRTVLLVLASLALVAFAGGVLTLTFRELKKDAQRRKHIYRRSVKHHDTSTPAHAS